VVKTWRLHRLVDDWANNTAWYRAATYARRLPSPPSASRHLAPPCYAYYSPRSVTPRDRCRLEQAGGHRLHLRRTASSATSISGVSTTLNAILTRYIDAQPLLCIGRDIKEGVAWGGRLPLPCSLPRTAPFPLLFHTTTCLGPPASLHIFTYWVPWCLHHCLQTQLLVGLGPPHLPHCHVQTPPHTPPHTTPTPPPDKQAMTGW